MLNTQPSTPVATTSLLRWGHEELSLSVTESQLETLDWFKFMQAGLAEVDTETVVRGYEQLKDQFNLLLQQQDATKEPTPNNDWVYALLQQLVVMYLYAKTAAKRHPLMEVEANQWSKQATKIMTKVPKNIYFEQLNRLVETLCEKKSVENTIDRALFELHQCTLLFYFQQFLEGLNPTRANHPCAKEESLCHAYIEAINRMYTYSTLFSTLLPTEKKHIPNLLLDQLSQLIKSTSTLDLSPSWMESLKQWIQRCFNQLRLWHLTPPSDASTPTSPLLILSRRLKKSTKKAVQGERQSHQSLRERCWLYFSLHEHFVSLWGTEEEKHALEYQATALALFEGFMNTFDWPKSFKKGILNENPLQKPQRWTAFIRRKTPPVKEWESLLEPALKKLGIDLLRADWFGHLLFTERSFLHWLVLRQEPRLMAKLKAYACTEEYREYKGVKEIPFLEKETLYDLVRMIHEDFCSDLNKITQMILSVWFQKIGIMVPSTKLAKSLSKPGYWLNQINQEPQKKWEDSVPNLALTMLQAIEHLGLGLYFFPLFQQRWSALQETLAAFSGNSAEFVAQHHTEIAAVLKELLLIVHPDHKSEIDKNKAIINTWAKRYIPRIQGVKRDLQQFRTLNPNELPSLKTRTAAQSLLKGLKNLVLDCMSSHVWYVRWKLDLISSSPTLQLNYDTLRQRDIQLKKARREKEAEIGQKNAQLSEKEAVISEKDALLAKERQEKEKERREKEAVMAELEQLKAVLAQREGQTPPQATLSGSRVTLFSAQASSQDSTTGAEHPVLQEHPHA